MTFAPISIGELATLLGVLVMLYFSLRTKPAEVKKVTADATEAFIKALTDCGAEVERASATNRKLRKELDECCDELAKVTDERNKFSDYSEVLAHQLRSHRITPEPFPENGHENLPAHTPIPTRPRREPKTKEE